MSYAGLNRRANVLARRILAHSGPGAEPVALLFDHGAEVVAAILGGLKAGKFSVLLDPSHPPERLRHLLADSGARLIVADSRGLALGQTLSAEPGGILAFDGGAEDVPDTNVDVSVSPDALAMIIYTSGSTGRPKGVMHTHRNVLADVRHQTALGIGVHDRSVWHTSGGFAGSMRTILGALLNGAALYAFDTRRQGFAQLADWLQHHQITIFRTVPTTFRTFMATLSGGLVFPSVRIVSMGGEPLFRADVESFNRHFPPHCVLVHPFGPTECMLVCWNVIPHGAPIAGHKVPIGRTLPDMTVLLLDEAGRPVPDGEVGEIVVKSRYLSPGYWRDPVRTDAVFLPGAHGSDERFTAPAISGRCRAMALSRIRVGAISNSRSAASGLTSRKLKLPCAISTVSATPSWSDSRATTARSGSSPTSSQPGGRRSR